MSPLTYLFWLALIMGAGWTAFPLACRALGADLPDAGLAVGRILFLGLWTLLAFWLGHIGVPTALSAWLYAPLALLGICVGWRDRDNLKAVWRRHQRTLIATEVIFLTVFLGFFVLRGFWSDTNGGNGEKSMDAALIGSLARAEKLPPPNPYAAGARLQSYYYFGHLETALLTRASGTSARWSYNLMCATLPALCFAALFSLGAALTRSNKGGAWVAGAVLAGGTLQPIYQWANLDESAKNRLLGLDPFAVSRVIPYTINEFPWFTFNQADLHGHYFDFPFQIALMTLGWSLLRAKRLKIALVAALFCGATILTNTWDFPAFTLLIGLSIIAVKGDAKTQAKAETSWGEANSERKPITLATRIMLAVGVVVVALLVAAPFLLKLQSAANPPQLLDQPASSLREWLLLWGSIAGGWWIFSGYSTFKDNLTWRATLALMGAGVLVAAAFNAWQTPSILVLPIIGVSAGFAVAGAVFNRGTARFLCLLALCGLVALAWSETTWAGFLGSSDNPGSEDYKRQDTVFKFGLQVWMLWGTASAAGLWLVAAQSSPLLRNIVRAIAVPLALVMLAGNLAFTLHRVRIADIINAQRAGQSEWLSFDAWDGWAHLAPPEKVAAAWLQLYVKPGENIVEAEQKPGGDYSEYTRYTHATGIPTVIGPQAHSYQWNPANALSSGGKAGREAKAGAEWGEVFRRKADVQRVYSPISNAERVQILRGYGVKYLVWGELERQEYGENTIADMTSLPMAAQFGERDDPHRVTIFRVD